MMMALRIPFQGAVEASTRLARLWGARVAHFNRLLALHPEHDEAWWWRVRLRINQYLLARYGAHPGLREHRPVPRADTRPIAITDDGPGPRGGPELRQMMTGLVQINRERRSLDGEVRRHELVVRLFEVFDQTTAAPGPIVSDVDGLSRDFAGLPWCDIHPETIEHRAAQLHRFGPVALAFCLPAFLRFALLNPHVEASTSVMEGLARLPGGRFEMLESDQCLVALECIRWVLLESLAEDDVEGFAMNEPLLGRIERELVRQAALCRQGRLRPVPWPGADARFEAPGV